MVVDLAEKYFLNCLMEKVLEGSTFIVENNSVEDSVKIDIVDIEAMTYGIKRVSPRAPT